ncbi:MAG: carbon monoxide dehydrogenase subunit G [Gammaproteobacteria bacterium]|nr:carbon monoxide dehydrogenase subunit G [Gammaproteobacteria bacterium]
MHPRCHGGVRALSGRERGLDEPCMFGCRGYILEIPGACTIIIRMNSRRRTGAVRVGGEYLLPAPRPVVWRRLNDPGVLKYCIRGCEMVVRDADGEYRAVFRFGVGPVKKRLDARLLVEETDPPVEYLLHAETTLRALGHATGRARVLLECRDAETLLAYRADITVSGWFAMLGDGLLTTAADRYMALFFRRFADVVV